MSCFEQIGVTSHSESKMAASLVLCSPPPPCTTTTTVPGVPDFRHRIEAKPEEAGSLSIGTPNNGCRLTWELFQLSSESLPRLDMMLINGWRHTLFPTAIMVSDFSLTSKREEPGYGYFFFCLNMVGTQNVYVSANLFLSCGWLPEQAR